MRVTLPESQRMRKQSTGVTSFSIVVHALVLGVAVVTTARSEVRRTVTPPDIVRYVKPTVLPRRIARPTDGGGGFTPVTQGLIPPIDVPDSLPPITIPASGFDPAEWARGLMPGEQSHTLVEPTARSGDPFTETNVERAVIPRAGNPTPHYPRMLQQAGMEGSVVVRFVVDTLGVVEASSISVVQTSHDLFARAVRDALVRMRFTPAEAGGRLVRQLVEQRFGFEMRGGR